MINKWLNYGDVNPLDYYGIWISQENTGDYIVVKVINMYDACNGTGYLLEDCMVDITDSWIDLEAVYSFMGIDGTDPIMVALGIVEYYGCYQCSGSTENVTSRKEARQYINNFGIVIHRNKTA